MFAVFPAVVHTLCYTTKYTPTKCYYINGGIAVDSQILEGVYRSRCILTMTRVCGKFMQASAPGLPFKKYYKHMFKFTFTGQKSVNCNIRFRPPFQKF